ncbi:MAG: hypothetical protein V1773_11730 [bacterium]
MSKKILVLIAVIIIEGCSIGNNIYQGSNSNPKIGEGITGEATISRDVNSSFGFSVGISIFPESMLTDDFKKDFGEINFATAYLPYTIVFPTINMSETWASVKYYPLAQSLNIYPYIGGGLGYCLLQTSSLPDFQKDIMIDGQLFETAARRQTKDILGVLYCRAEGGLVFHPFRSIIDNRFGKNFYISGSINYDFRKFNENINLDGYQFSLKVGYSFYFDN